LLSATHMCLCVCVCSWPGGSREQGHRRTSYHVSQPTTKNDPYLESQCLYHGFKTLHDGLLGILKTMIDIIQHSPSRKKKKKKLYSPTLKAAGVLAAPGEAGCLTSSHCSQAPERVGMVMRTHGEEAQWTWLTDKTCPYGGVSGHYWGPPHKPLSTLSHNVRTLDHDFWVRVTSPS
jgi:hypothetical protein